MEIKGQVYCLFEQSGTFKSEFIKLGIPAEDYDIQNDFGETDHQIDLFAEIENAYVGTSSIFDDIAPEDLVIAFFPCIYFETIQQLYFCLSKFGLRNESKQFQIEYAMDRLDKRTEFHKLLYKLLWVAYDKKYALSSKTPPRSRITSLPGRTSRARHSLTMTGRYGVTCSKSPRHIGSSTASLPTDGQS